MTRTTQANIRLKPEASQALINAVLQDRITGVLVGSALGDAIGLYTEFLSAATSLASYPDKRFALSPEPTPFRRDWHRSPHQTGEWTDDTDHALLILLSFLHNSNNHDGDGEDHDGDGLDLGPGLDPGDFARRLTIWVRMGLRALDTLPLGLGATVGRIVRSKGYEDDPEGKAYEVWEKGGRNVAPNGSLMRTHPLGLLCLTRTQEETFAVAAAFSVVTHVDPRCVVACAIGTDLVRGLVLGEYTAEADVDGVIDAAVAWYGPWAAERHGKLGRSGEVEPLDLAELDRHVRGVVAAAGGERDPGDVGPASLQDLQLDDSQKIGYVYKCLGSGILLLRLAMRRIEAAAAAATSETPPMTAQLEVFEDLITDLTLEGGDADTNAVFAGALLGALVGYRGLPPHWRDGLRHGTWLMGKADALCRVVGVAPGRRYDGKVDVDTAPDGGRGLLSEHVMDGRWMELQARIAREDSEHKRKEEEAEKKKSGGFLGMFKPSK